MDLKSLIREIPDFPKPGILFRDITTLLQNPVGMCHAIDQLAEQCAVLEPDYIVGIESRGFIFGMPVAYKLNRGFVPIRKPGKLPAAIHAAEYELEYGRDRVEMHQDAFTPGARVLILDDLLATGGTAAAAAELITQTEAELVGMAFVIELAALEGRQKLPQIPVISLLEY